MSTLHCRFCAEEKPSSNIKNLENEIESRNFVMKKLSLFSDVFVDFDNKSLPQTVCDICFNTLNDCYEFFIKVKRSQDVLTQCFDTKVDVEILKLEQVDTGVTEDADSYPESSDNITDLSWSTYPWQCAHCTRTMLSMHDLREHSKSEHKTCYGYKCADCDEFLTCFEDFIEHVRTHWEYLRKYCEFCNIKMEDAKHTHTHTNQHTCTFCGETFQDETLLLLHLTLYMSKPTGLLAYGTEICDFGNQINSWTDYPCICKYCKVKFVHRDVLNEHCVKVHKKCFGLKCIDCDETQKSFMEFVKHVHKHRAELVQICPYCDEDMGYFDTFHIEKHITNHMCNFCGETFPMKHGLRRHQMKLNTSFKPRTRRKGPLTDKDLTCEICGKIMKTTISLKTHKTRHMKRERLYTCEVCGKSFYTKGSLNSHNNIHNNTISEICKICNKTFKTINRLRKHVKTHNFERPYQCDSCKRYFNSKDRLREHVKTHMDIMPYECSYCNKRFRHKSILKTHLNQHTGARPYSCNSCGMDFTNWSNCNKHMKRKHGTTLAKNVMTPHGKLPLNPDTGRPEEILMSSIVKEWSQQVLLVSRKKS